MSVACCFVHNERTQETVCYRRALLLSQEETTAVMTVDSAVRREGESIYPLQSLK
jgi:hypothetical protein